MQPRIDKKECWDRGTRRKEKKIVKQDIQKAAVIKTQGIDTNVLILHDGLNKNKYMLAMININTLTLSVES